MATKTSVKTGGDVLIHRESVQYNMQSARVKGAASGGAHTIAQIAGYPIKMVSGNAVLVIAGDEANATGLLLHGPAISALADDALTAVASPYSVITKGEGVVINEDAVPSNDCQATPSALTWSTLKTTLGALGFKFVTEPTVTDTQLY